MSDTTVTDEPEQPAAPASSEVEPVAPAPTPVPFWNRPYVERYLVPLVLPVAVVVGIVFYVLNVSRLFLSAHGHIPVIVGSVITLIILVGATVLSAAPNARRGPTILITCGFIMSITFAGWISLGHSQEKDKGPEALPATLAAKQEVKITEAPGGAFTFNPTELDATTGLAKIDVNFAAAGHKFAFHETDVLFKELAPPGTGTDVGVAFFPKPGDYNFFCSVQGHESAGMHGIIHVTGDPTTLEAALAKDGIPASALKG